MKEGVRGEEEGLGDADGEEEEEEDGKEAGRVCSAGHAVPPATGPWHAAGRRLCGLVCEVVGMEGVSNRTRRGEASHEKGERGWGGRGILNDVFACFIHILLHSHTTTLKDAPQRQTHTGTSTSKQEQLSKQQQNLRLSFAQVQAVHASP